jgi:hypothetical protein
MPGSARHRTRDTWHHVPANEVLRWYVSQTTPFEPRIVVTPAGREQAADDRDGRDLWDYLGDFA